MPTPFSHLWIAYRLFSEEHLNGSAQTLIKTHLPAFLLGSIVADAKPTPTSERADTHFYRYDQPIDRPIWRKMLRDYPTLCEPTSDAQHAFLAGYVAHLASDEYWSIYMLKPHFAYGKWGGSLSERFRILHYLLIYMDERDERRLPDTYAEILRTSAPEEWLPFLSDDVMCEWRDYISRQLIGESETVTIFSHRIQADPLDTRAILDDQARMSDLLWNHVSVDTLHQLEDDMFDYTLEQMRIYLHA